MGREITDFDAAELRRLRTKVDNITGPGITNTPTSIAINPPNPTSGPRGGNPQVILPGQYQGMSLYTVSQNQIGWTFCQAVAISP